jgi:hypothetical protein
MWEYEGDLQRFGTPMALMLLPYFTDGCIGSMEGLYFEASSTTPFHFLNQSALSEAAVAGPARPALHAVRHRARRPAAADARGALLHGDQRDRDRGGPWARDDLTEVAAERFVGSGSADGISRARLGRVRGR